MKKSITYIALFFAGTAFAQTNDRFVEVAVEEIIELKATDVYYTLTVQSPDDQMDYDYNYDLDYLEEELYYMTDDEDLFPAERKKREKERAQLEKERDEKMKERERQIAEFKPFTNNDLIQLLKTNNLTYSIQIEKNRFDFYGDGNSGDTVFLVTLHNKAELDKMNSAIETKAVDSDYAKSDYETADNQYAQVIPNLTNKAKERAALVATTLGKKAGNIISCTNVHPGYPELLLTLAMQNVYDDNPLLSGGSYLEDPFSRTKKTFIQFIYRFELN